MTLPVTVTFTVADTHAVVVVEAELVPLFVGMIVTVTLVVVVGDREDTRDVEALAVTEAPPTTDADPTFVELFTTLFVANELPAVVAEIKADADKKPVSDGLRLDTREKLDLKDEDTDTEFDRD